MKRFFLIDFNTLKSFQNVDPSHTVIGYKNTLAIFDFLNASCRVTKFKKRDIFPRIHISNLT